MVIPQKIKDINRGNPWATEDVAKASYDVSRFNNKFFYNAAAARDYGLTTGGRDSDEIALADIGRRIVFAGTPEELATAKRDAFFNIGVFRDVFAYYKGNNLPDDKTFLGNTLQRQFAIDPLYHDDFADLFRKNCGYVGFPQGQDVQPDALPNPSDSVVQPHITVVAEPKSGTKIRAFVAMPFWERNAERAKGFFTEVLKSLITPAGVQAGLTIETANKEGSDVIHSTIINDLINADLVIADLTDHNLNVLFELGVRMALDKPTALIKAKGTGPIFDVDGTLRVKEYDPCLWPSTLEVDVPKLADHFRATWENRNSDMTYMKILTRKPTS